MLNGKRLPCQGRRQRLQTISLTSDAKLKRFISPPEIVFDIPGIPICTCSHFFKPICFMTSCTLALLTFCDNELSIRK